jgi:hypothetical protein
MKDALAERLLAVVMKWKEEDVARERPDLQAMAAYKYDEYRQFSPGMRFVESLALWLNQFETQAERAVAYDFVKKRLVFCSSAEMYHLVAMAYKDFVRPYLLQKTAAEAGLSRWSVGPAARLQAFAVRERRCLFLGLSDGARMDAFRRLNPNLSTEQVRHSHELSDERVEELLSKLGDALKVLGKEPRPELATFRTLVLLDDFSGSGYSYVRKKEGEFKGKLAALCSNVRNPEHILSKLVATDGLEVVVVLYMATEKAATTIRGLLKEMLLPIKIEFEIFIVFPLADSVALSPSTAGEFGKLIETYYDDANETPSTKLGGTDLRYGFGSCGLPLILNHNTPNNSIALLWANGTRMKALFQRVSRFKKEKV